MTLIPLPSGQEPVIDKVTGMMVATWYRFFDTARRQQDSDSSSFAANKANINQLISGHWLIDFPEAKPYKLVLNAPFPFTITSTSAELASGTCNAQFDISGTPLDGGAHSVTTGLSTIAHSTANAVVGGQDVTVTISGVSTPQGLSLTIVATRQLAA